MKKWITVGVAVLTVLAVLWALPYIIDMEAMKKKAVPYLESAVNRKVEIRTLRLMFLPRVALRAEGVTLYEDPSIPGEVFAYAESIDVRLRLLPLLQRNIVVSGVSLESPSLLLLKSASGTMNISTLGRSTETGDAPSKTGEDRGFLSSFSLEELTVRNGTVTYSEGKPGEAASRTTVIEEVDADLHHLSLGRTLDLELNFRKRGEPARIRFEGKAGPLNKEGIPDRATGILSIGKNDLKIEAEREENGFRVRAASDSLVPMEVITLLPGGEKALGPGVTLNGRVSLSTDTRLSEGKWNGALKADFGSLSITIDDSFKKADGVPFSFSGDYAGSPDQWRFSDVVVKASNAEIRGSGTYSPKGKPVMAGAFVSNTFDLAPWSAMIPAVSEKGLAGRSKISGTITRTTLSSPLVYAIDVVLDDVRAKIPGLPKEIREMRGSLGLAPDRVTFQNISLKSGESDLSVSGNIKNFDAPIGDLTVGSNVLRLDDFKSPEAPGSASVSEDRKKNKAGKQDNILMRSAVRADLRLKKVEIGKTPLTDVKGLLIADRGTIHLEDLAFVTADGNFRTKGTADLSGNKPVFDLSTQVEHLPINSILKRYTSAGDVLEGSADAVLKYKGEGAGWDDLSRTLSGEGTLMLKNGMIRKSNLLVEALGLAMSGPRAVSQFLGISQDKMSRDSAFRTWETRLSFSGGRLSLSDIKLVAGDYVLTGAGTIGLDKTLDFRTQVRVGSSIGRGLARLPLTNFLVDNDGNAVIPMKVAGTVSSPRYLPDAAYIRDQAGSHIKEKTLNLLKGVIPGGNPPPPRTPGESDATPPSQRPPSLKDLFRGIGQ